jgi:HK97 gp10 family phage protein
MADIDIITNLTGLDELEQTLIAGGQKSAQKFLRTVEKKAAQPVLEAMQETVPIGLTGDLLVSLKIQSQSAKDGVVVMIGPTSDENFIGRFSNFGTEKQPATHWMDRAWAASKEAALDGFIQAATESLNEMSK